MRVNLDYETYSEADLEKVGAYVYAAHPSTRIELAAWAKEGEDVKQWDIAENILFEDSELFHLLHTPGVQWEAFNASFERIITRDVLSINIPASRWRCTMQRAWALSFSGRLGEVGRQMGLPQDKRKMADGRKLCLKFCKPAPASHKADRYDYKNCPEEWERYRQYNRQDVIAEREIGLVLPYLSDWEQSLWEMDQDINDRGVPVDRALIDRAVHVDRIEKHRLRGVMNQLTGLGNANSTQQLVPWLLQRGVQVPKKWSKPKKEMTYTLEKEAVERILEGPLFGELDPLARQVLEIRLKANQTSTKKWSAFQACIGDDDRVRGMFQFGGAQRTQRWAGRLVQLHNLKQGYSNADEVADIFMQTDLDTLHTLFGEPVDVLSMMIRAAITAPDGRTLSVEDLSAIESRVLGWVSGCTAMNLVFAQGRDTYRAFGAEYYGKPEDEITSEERKFCKPPVLGCGYRLGAEGLIKYAEKRGVELTLDEAERLVSLFRQIYPEIPQLWYWLDGVVKAAIRMPGQVFSKHKVSIVCDEQFLRIYLPSGRPIHYYQPSIDMIVPPWGGDPRPTVTYMGMDQIIHQWSRIQSHGGKFTENIVQAIARDILAWHLKTMHPHIPLVLHIHDEGGAEVREEHGPAALSYMKQVMCTTPPWAQGLLLGAEGFTTKRYRKD